jgi:hypothetical protein
MNENQKLNAWMQIIWYKKNKTHIENLYQKKMFEIKEYQIKKNIINEKHS